MAAHALHLAEGENGNFSLSIYFCKARGLLSNRFVFADFAMQNFCMKNLVAFFSLVTLNPRTLLQNNEVKRISLNDFYEMGECLSRSAP
jgi:hypothetical protein